MNKQFRERMGDENERRGLPRWYRYLRKEAAYWKRVTQRRFRRVEKQALHHERDMPTKKGTQGWMSW